MVYISKYKSTLRTIQRSGICMKVTIMSEDNLKVIEKSEDKSKVKY